MKIKIAYVEVALSMLIISSAVVINKHLTAKLPTAMISELRLLLSAGLQFALLRLTGGASKAPNARDWRIMCITAFVGVFLCSLFYLEGLRRTTALETSIISALIPVAGAFLSLLVFKEKMGAKHGLGFSITAIGTVMVCALGGLTGGQAAGMHLAGNVLIFASTFGQAVFMTFGKLVSPRVHPLAAGGIVSSMGALMFLPLTVIGLSGFDASVMAPADWAMILYLGLVSSGLGIVMMNHGIRAISSSSVSALTALNPVGAILLSCTLLGDTLNVWHILGIAIIAAGIYLVLGAARPAGRGTFFLRGRLHSHSTPTSRD